MPLFSWNEVRVDHILVPSFWTDLPVETSSLDGVVIDTTDFLVFQQQAALVAQRLVHPAPDSQPQAIFFAVFPFQRGVRASRIFPALFESDRLPISRMLLCVYGGVNLRFAVWKTHWYYNSPSKARD